jgi:hypothetical protein
MTAEPHMVQVQGPSNFIKPGLQSLVNGSLGILFGLVERESYTLEYDVLVSLLAGKTPDSTLNAETQQTFLELARSNSVWTRSPGD